MNQTMDSSQTLVSLQQNPPSKINNDQVRWIFSVQVFASAFGLIFQAYLFDFQWFNFGLSCHRCMPLLKALNIDVVMSCHSVCICVCLLWGKLFCLWSIMVSQRVRRSARLIMCLRAFQCMLDKCVYCQHEHLCFVIARCWLCHHMGILCCFWWLETQGDGGEDLVFIIRNQLCWVPLHQGLQEGFRGCVFSFLTVGVGQREMNS